MKPRNHQNILLNYIHSHNFSPREYGKDPVENPDHIHPLQLLLGVVPYPPDRDPPAPPLVLESVPELGVAEGGAVDSDAGAVQGGGVQFVVAVTKGNAIERVII